MPAWDQVLPSPSSYLLFYHLCPFTCTCLYLLPAYPQLPHLLLYLPANFALLPAFLPCTPREDSQHAHSPCYRCSPFPFPCLFPVPFALCYTYLHTPVPPASLTSLPPLPDLFTHVYLTPPPPTTHHSPFYLHYYLHSPCVVPGSCPSPAVYLVVTLLSSAHVTCINLICAHACSCALPFGYYIHAFLPLLDLFLVCLFCMPLRTGSALTHCYHTIACLSLHYFCPLPVPSLPYLRLVPFHYYPTTVFLLLLSFITCCLLPFGPQHVVPYSVDFLYVLLPCRCSFYAVPTTSYPTFAAHRCPYPLTLPLTRLSPCVLTPIPSRSVLQTTLPLILLPTLNYCVLGLQRLPTPFVCAHTVPFFLLAHGSAPPFALPHSLPSTTFPPTHMPASATTTTHAQHALI